MANNTFLRTFEEVHNDYTNINLEYFFLEQLGKLNLKEELRFIIKDIHEKLEIFYTIRQRIPDSVLSEITETYSSLRDWALATSMKSLEWLSNNRSQIQEQFTFYDDKIKKLWSSTSAFYLDYILENNELNNNSKKETENLKQELSDLRVQSNFDAQEINSLKQRLESELNQFDEKYKGIFTRGELLNQEEIFLKTSRKNATDAKTWKGYIIILFATLIILSIFFLCTSINGLDDIFSNKSLKAQNAEFTRAVFYFEIVKKCLLRLFILSIVLYALKFAIRNYNAFKHNEVINSHKANSFAAAPILADRLKSTEGQDSIIHTASNEIFTQRNTGYIEKDNEAIDTNLLQKIIDMVSSFKK